MLLLLISLLFVELCKVQEQIFKINRYTEDVAVQYVERMWGNCVINYNYDFFLILYIKEFSSSKKEKETIIRLF